MSEPQKDRRHHPCFYGCPDVIAHGEGAHDDLCTDEWQPPHLADTRPEGCARCEARVAEMVALLDALTNDDPEAAHAFADGILAACAPAPIAAAYVRAAQRVGFWYA